MTELLLILIFEIALALSPQLSAAQSPVQDRAPVQERTATTPPVRFALLQSLTGAAAVDGETVVKAAQLAAEEINKSTTGPLIELEIQDDHADAKNSVSAFHQMLLSKPDAVIGGTWSYLVAALAPLAMQTKTVLVNTSTIPECVHPEKFRGYVFTTAPAAMVENIVFASELHEGTTAVLVTGPTPYSEAHRVAFKKIAQEHGVKILQELTYTSITGDDVSAFAPKVRQLNPDIIYIILLREQFDTFLRRLRELSVRSKILTDKNGYFGFLASKNLPAYEGICMSYPLASLQRHSEFGDAYKAHFHEAPQMYADVSYDAVKLVYQATLESRATNSDLSSTLPKTKFKGIGGSYTFSNGRFVGEAESSLVCVEGGKAVIRGL